MAEQTQKISLEVAGMSCANCSATVSDALESLAGVRKANVNFATDEASVEFDPDTTSLADIYRAIEDAGYEPVSDTVSIGISALPATITRSFDMLMLDAERRLKEARENGNTVIPAPDDAAKDGGKKLTASLDEAVAIMQRREEKMSREQAAVTMRHLLPLLEHCDSILNLDLADRIEPLKQKYRSK
jgi:Cu+-exporting ATPase